METLVEKVKNVLVPTDFSEVCESAILQAIEVVKEHDGTVHILHVHTSDKSEVIAESENLLKLLPQKFNYKNIVTHTEKGDIFTTINEVAEKLEVDIIIMGTHGKVGLQKILGSFVLKIVDSTKVPVIVTQGKVFEGGFKNILFPVSLLDEDRQKTAIAVKLAKMFHSKVHIFPRYESSKVGEKQMINTILQIKTYFNRYNIDFEVSSLVTTSENFQKKILAYSKEISADLILIISDSSNHLPLITPKEETILFNDSQTPVLCMEVKRSKKTSFSAAG